MATSEDFNLAIEIPETENRVELSSSLSDSSGILALALLYRISDNSQALMDWHVARASESLLEAGALEIKVTHHISNGHFMGTARMGDDPESSAVDRWGVAHDVPNLVIADSSTFVTAGGVNPTATLCALALRTADGIVANRWRPPVERPATVAPGGDRATVDVSERSEIEVSAPILPPTERERQQIGRAADLLIPTDEAMPVASSVGIHRDLLDRVLRVRPDLLELLRGGVQRLLSGVDSGMEPRCGAVSTPG